VFFSLLILLGKAYSSYEVSDFNSEFPSEQQLYSIGAVCIVVVLLVSSFVVFLFIFRKRRRSRATKTNLGQYYIDETTSQLKTFRCADHPSLDSIGKYLSPDSVIMMDPSGPNFRNSLACSADIYRLKENLGASCGYNKAESLFNESNLTNVNQDKNYYSNGIDGRQLPELPRFSSEPAGNSAIFLIYLFRKSI